MSETKEMTVGHVAALVISTRALLAKFGGRPFSRAKVRDAVTALMADNLADPEARRAENFDELANLLHVVQAALVDFG